MRVKFGLGSLGGEIGSWGGDGGPSRLPAHYDKEIINKRVYEDGGFCRIKKTATFLRVSSLNDGV